MPGLRCRFLQSGVNAIRQLAEAVIAVLETVIAHDDNAEARFITTLWHANRAGCDRFDVCVAGQGVPMVMTGKEVFYAKLAE